MGPILSVPAKPLAEDKPKDQPIKTKLGKPGPGALGYDMPHSDEDDDGGVKEMDVCGCHELSHHKVDWSDQRQSATASLQSQIEAQNTKESFNTDKASPGLGNVQEVQGLPYPEALTCRPQSSYENKKPSHQVITNVFRL